MTRIFNNPKNFPEESLKGLVSAFPESLHSVFGGVVRRLASPSGEVAVVVGGGSGHYPAFAGWVGQGMAHGAVCGNIFSSPSATQVFSVARNADNGGGVLLLFGNYAGDVLHFGHAAEELEKLGIPTRIVKVSDDIASNTPDAHEDRRGIAGDFVVTKVAGAAAAAGHNLLEVERLARKANMATRSLGVAFSGCTVPGDSRPLFEVEEGSYALGLGIHGEPGIATHPVTDAADLAELLVQRILEEAEYANPNGNEKRVGVVVNGFGSTKYEELFLLFGEVSSRLENQGFSIVKPVVGEQVTSLDMAGVSLSLLFLDVELEPLWLAAADTPAFYEAGPSQGSSGTVREIIELSGSEFIEGSPESRQLAMVIVQALGRIEEALLENEEMLGVLDSVAGDGDHGRGMSLGISAARAAAATVADQGGGAATTLARASSAWSDGAGGTSGALWAGAMKTAADGLSDSAGSSDLDVAAAVLAGVRSIAHLGGAAVGDKTMVDATAPFADAFEAALRQTADVKEAWDRAIDAARQGVLSTEAMVARKGRARTHGQASLGHADPGAKSFVIVMEAISDVWA